MLQHACVRLPGYKATGEPKLRAIDDFSRSGVNAATQPCERLRCDSLDQFFAVLQSMEKRFAGMKMALFKADIDSAYRRVPVRAQDRKHAAVVFHTSKGLMLSEHFALPFGSVGSVYGWDRPGFMLRSFARRILKIPVLRYVDDYFGADRLECVDVALDALARLVRACLGPTAIAKHKLEVGNPLVILGIRVEVTAVGARFSLDKAKAEDWAAQIADALACMRLFPGAACVFTFVKHVCPLVFCRCCVKVGRPLGLVQQRLFPESGSQFPAALVCTTEVQMQPDRLWQWPGDSTSLVVDCALSWCMCRQRVGTRYPAPVQDVRGRKIYPAAHCCCSCCRSAH